MRRIAVLLTIFLPIVSIAQVEQKGFVRLKADKVGGKKLGLEGVIVSAHKANTVKSDAQGRFTLIFSQKHYADSISITLINKNGYELLSAHLLQKGAWNLSAKNPMEIVMVKTIDRIREQNAIERRLRNKLKSEFEENIQTLENQLEQQSITLEKYQRQYTELVKKYENTEWIGQEAERLAKTDYATLDSLQAAMTDLRKQGIGDEIVSLAKQNISQPVLTQLENNPQMMAQRIAKQEQQLSIELKYHEFLAEQLLNIADGFRMQMRYDSTEHYLKLRTSLDAQNYDFLMDYTRFLFQQKKFGQLQKVLESFASIKNLTDSQLAATHHLKGELFYATNRYKDAENEYLSSIELFSKGTTANDKSAQALSLRQLGYLCMKQGRESETEKYLASAYNIYLNLNNDDSISHIGDLSITLRYMANLHERQYRFAEAEKELKLSLEYCKRIPLPEMSQYEQSLKLYGLGNLYHNSNNYEAALTNYRQSAKILKQLMSQNADAYTLDYTRATDGIAQILDLKLHTDSAEYYYNLSIALRENLTAQSPAIYEKYLAESYGNMAGFLSEQKRYDEAERMYLKALQTKRSLCVCQPEVYSPSMALTLNNLGWLYSELNNFAESEKYYAEAVSVYRQLCGSNPQIHAVPLARTLNNFAKLHDDMGNLQLAEKEYAEVIAIYDKVGKNDNAIAPYKALAMNNLAKVYEATERYSKAEKLYKKSLAIFIEAEKLSPDVFKYYISILYLNLSNLYSLQGKWRLSMDNLLKSKEILQELAEKSPQAYSGIFAEVLEKLIKLSDKLNETSVKTEAQQQLNTLQK